MSLYHFGSDRLSRLDETSFIEAGLKERGDIQRLLQDDLDVVAPNCLLISAEFDRWTESRRRIDLLALDQDAVPVVIELKRVDDPPFVELQALTYAAMASTMTFEQAVSIYADFLSRRGLDVDARTSILDFLGWDEPSPEKFAQDVRVILVASNFDKDVTSTVLWLRDRDIDIRCVRVRPYRWDNQLFIHSETVIPLPEAEQFQIRVRDKSQEEREHRRGSARKASYELELEGRRVTVGMVKDLAYKVIEWAVSTGATPEAIEAAIPFPRKPLWVRIGGVVSEPEVGQELDLRAAEPGGSKYQRGRWFYRDGQRFVVDGDTYILSTQWTGPVAETASEILFREFGKGGTKLIKYPPSDAVESHSR